MLGNLYTPGVVFMLMLLTIFATQDVFSSPATTFVELLLLLLPAIAVSCTPPSSTTTEACESFWAHLKSRFPQAVWQHSILLGLVGRTIYLLAFELKSGPLSAFGWIFVGLLALATNLVSLETRVKRVVSIVSYVDFTATYRARGRLFHHRNLLELVTAFAVLHTPHVALLPVQILILFVGLRACLSNRRKPDTSLILVLLLCSSQSLVALQLLAVILSLLYIGYLACELRCHYTGFVQHSFAASIYLPSVLFSSVPFFVCLLAVCRALVALTLANTSFELSPDHVVQLQNGVLEDSLPESTSRFISSLAKLEKLMKDRFVGSSHVVSVVIGVAILVYQLSRSRNKPDAVVAIAAFCNCLVGNREGINAMILERFSADFGETTELQGFSDYISSAGEGLSRLRSIRSSTGLEKIRRFSLFALSLGLFESVGVTMDSAGYSEIEAAGIRKKFRPGIDFLDSLLEMALFIVTAGHQMSQGAGIEAILHTSESYAKLYEDFNTFSSDFERFKGFGVTSGVDHSTLLSRCLTLREKFTAVLPMAKQLSVTEMRMMRVYWTKILAIEAELRCSDVCQSTRAAPFSVLLSGASGVGKSALIDILFSYFGKLRKLPTTSKHKYTVSPVSEFWDGYDSHMWTVIMDDIAFRHPGLKQADPSVDLILNVVNNVPMMTPQASLEKKGTTPLLASLVLGTTNTPDLNAKAYYDNPAAVLRRFPYVVDVKVKSVYATGTGSLDPSKIPENMVYSDIWNLTVTHVQAVNKKQVRHDVIGTFTSMPEFLTWYKSAIETFYVHQTQSVDATNRVIDMPLCDTCKLPTVFCKCVTPVLQGGWFRSLPKENWLRSYVFLMYYTIWTFLGSFVLGLSFIWTVPNWVVSRSNSLRYRYFFLKCQMSLENFYFRWVGPPPRVLFKRIGDRVEKRIIRVPKAFKVLAVVLTFVIATHAVWKVFSPKVQGNVASTEQAPRKMSVERSNIYHSDSGITSDFAGSSVGETTTTKAFVDRVARNVVVGEFDTGDGKCHFGRFVGIGGRYYLGNNHTVPPKFKNATFVLGSRRDGVSESIDCVLNPSDIMRDKVNDLCILRVSSLPLRSSLLRYFGDSPTLGAANGTYVNRSEHGETQPIHVGKVNFTKAVVPGLSMGKRAVAMSAGHVETTRGDCGMPLVVENGTRKSIVGIHVAAISNPMSGESRSFATLVSSQSVTALMQQFPEQASDVVSDNAPVLNGATVQRPYGTLHHKSVFRYLEDGSVSLHGSFTGFRGQHKSAVCSTQFRSKLSELGIISEFDKPVMTGWRPWRIAALALTKPVTAITTGAVRRCGDSFLSDIKKSVNLDTIKFMVEKYDTFTSLNGAEGIAFVDGIKRGTSAGAPWRTSKKRFTHPVPPERGLNDPIGINAEISSRVEAIEAGYRRGVCYRPLFTAHLKDEAVNAAKQASGKTRVFCGAPFDWSIVVRKFFLGHIRLIQNHKFKFECAVGTVAQSIEWSRAYAYVTRFGEDRIVAGDYGAFDKTMPPAVILEAFRILIELAKLSGNFSKEDITSMWCIAHDTAYGLTDFNGDLVTFWGSNPSGHPLTVIINSLVNSLYVRLVYETVHPLDTFRDNVSLLTYGDDNIMSVNKDCSGFHHTVLQDTFASLGIKYTMADKESASVPFINIAEASFLKRSWLYHPREMVYTAPLDETSIEKMLCVVVKSKVISWDQQNSDLIRVALSEYWFHGQEKFEWCLPILHQIVEDAKLQSWFEGDPLLSSEDFWKRFWECSSRVNFRI